MQKLQSPAFLITLVIYLFQFIESTAENAVFSFDGIVKPTVFELLFNSHILYKK